MAVKIQSTLDTPELISMLEKAVNPAGTMTVLNFTVTESVEAPQQRHVRVDCLTSRLTQTVFVRFTNRADIDKLATLVQTGSSKVTSSQFCVASVSSLVVNAVQPSSSPSPSGVPPRSSNDSMAVGMGVGIGVGISVLFLIIVVVYCCCCGAGAAWRRKRHFGDNGQVATTTAIGPNGRKHHRSNYYRYYEDSYYGDTYFDDARGYSVTNTNTFYSLDGDTRGTATAYSWDATWTDTPTQQTDEYSQTDATAVSETECSDADASDLEATAEGSDAAASDMEATAEGSDMDATVGGSDMDATVEGSDTDTVADGSETDASAEQTDVSAWASADNTDASVDDADPAGVTRNGSNSDFFSCTDMTDAPNPVSGGISRVKSMLTASCSQG